MGVNPVSQVPGDLGGDILMRQFFAVLADVSNAEAALTKIASARAAANEMITSANAELAKITEASHRIELDASVNKKAADTSVARAVAATTKASAECAEARELLASAQRQTKSISESRALVTKLVDENEHLKSRLVSELAAAEAMKAGAMRAQADAEVAEAGWNAKVRKLQEQVAAATS